MGLIVVASLGARMHAEDNPHNYAEALRNPCTYEVKRGPLSTRNRVEFRGPTATLRDGSDVGHDLTGGWYDASDTMKWTLNVLVPPCWLGRSSIIAQIPRYSSV